MKIGYIIPSKVKFGPTLVVYDLVKLMIERGHHVTVFYFDERQGDKLQSLIEFPCPTIKIKFIEKINFMDFDVIHSHGLRPDAYVFFHKPRNTKTCFVTTLHNFVKEELTFTYNKFVSVIFSSLWMKMVSRHDMRVVLSKTAKNYYTKWFDKDQLTYIYNTRAVNGKGELSEKEKEELLSFKGNDKLIGINAGATYRKGADQLIRALAKVSGVKVFALWRGADRADLRKIAREENVEDRVLFAGYREDAYRYIQYYDAFAVPSRCEGFPLAMLEAVALKSNLICSDIPIFKEFFSDDEATFFHLEDIQSMAAAIKAALTNNKAEKAFEKYVREFAPNVIAERYLSVYRGEHVE
jgi:glycosyltransferase involved in cell wall biosynthesis